MVKNALLRSKLVLLIGVLSLTGLSCEQFEYTSPLPGILEVRMAVKNTRQTLIPFGVLDSSSGLQSSFGMTLKDLRVTAPAAFPEIIQQRIYGSLNAIRRPDGGDIFNFLDLKARDSLILVGIGYVPPITFTGIRLDITPGPCLSQQFQSPSPCVVRSFGVYASNIIVTQLPPFQSTHLLPEDTQAPLAIRIEEGKTTRVVITFDLDRSLVRQEETFLYAPVFYVSSVTIQ